MRIINLSIFLSLLAACSGSNHEVSIDSGSVMQTNEADTCLCRELSIDSTGSHTLNSELFTGVCIENYPQTEIKYIEKQILKGKVHGKVSYFDRSGKVLFEEVFEEGEKLRSGESEPITCNCDELEMVKSSIVNGQKRYVLDNIPFTGNCKSYYPESDQVYMELNYHKGVLDGQSIFYNKDGSILYMEQYEKGELIKTLH